MRLLLLAALILSATGSALADPKTDYLLYCRGCHLANGNGVPPAVPTLRNEIGRLVASPEGRDYIIRVPGVSQTPMDDERLAKVLNWVLAEFNAETLPKDFRPLTPQEVRLARKKVLANPLEFRRTFWPD